MQLPDEYIKRLSVSQSAIIAELAREVLRLRSDLKMSEFYNERLVAHINKIQNELDDLKYRKMP